MASDKVKNNGLAPVWQFVLASIVVGGLFGAWGLNGQIATMAANLKNLERKIDRIEERIFYGDERRPITGER